MFSYIGLAEQQPRIHKEEYHIYLLNTGRVAMTGCK